jgi:Ca2+-binding RTX toxin-like protein
MRKYGIVLVVLCLMCLYPVLAVGGAAPPSNDVCTSAEGLTIPDLVDGETFSANPDGAPVCGTSNTAPGVWYTVVGTGNEMTATTDNPSSDYDTKLTVYCEGCGTLTCVDGNDDIPSDPSLRSRVTWCSQLGAEYLILVHGFGSAAGNFGLSITDSGVPCTGGVSCLPPTTCRGEATTDGCTVNDVPDQPCVGTDARDVIFGTDGNDVISGLGGNDVIKGQGGNDLICGEDGRDALHGNDGDDVLDGGPDRDNLQGNKGADTCINGEKNKKGCEVVTMDP